MPPSTELVTVTGMAVAEGFLLCILWGKNSSCSGVSWRTGPVVNVVGGFPQRATTALLCGCLLSHTWAVSLSSVTLSPPDKP